MISRMKPMRLLRLLVILAAGVPMISCGSRAQQPLSRLDTPEHHTVIGVRLLNQQKIAAAGREFELALKLDSRYARAQAGRGLVKAYQGDFAGGMESLKQAEKQIRSKEEKIFVLVGYIRLNILSHSACLRIGTECRRDDAWLKTAKDAFEQAVLIDPKDSSIYYFMGECYLTALDPDQAGRMFSRVLEINEEYVWEAEGRWKLVQKIRRAMPRTVTGKKIALLERITRAEAAALFLGELKIDALYARRAPNHFEKTFKDPEKVKRTALGRTVATDIDNHPLRTDIEGMVRIGMRGLDLYPDGSFRPDEPVDRANFAMMIEDILIKVTGDEALATRFQGDASPFPDMPADLRCFNAVMLATSRGLMEIRDVGSGEFAPFAPVGGADALLAIRKIREEFRF